MCPAEALGPDLWTEVPSGCVSLVALGKAPWRLEGGHAAWRGSGPCKGLESFWLGP